MREYLLNRDKELQLELEASHYLHYVTKDLAEIFPNSRFILTLRDPMSWIESEINQNIFTSTAINPIWRELEAFRYAQYDISRSQKEKNLFQYKNVWPIEAYFKYWSSHITTVIKNIPKDRMKIIPIWNLQKELTNITSFLFPVIIKNNIELKKINSGAGRRFIDLYKLVDRRYVEKLMLKNCEKVINELTQFIPKFKDKCFY